MAEASTHPVEALLALVRAQLLDVNTAIPGTIISYDNGMARVLPTGKKRFADGDALDYPIIPNVRVCWPSFSGGTAGIKGPVVPGDNCLLVFSQQAIDGSDDRRMFDLQDAYAVICDLGNSGEGQSGNNSDMIMFLGAAFVKITAGGEVEINAPGGVTIAGSVAQSGGPLTSNGITLDTHTHSGVQAGASNTGSPNA